LERAGYRFLDAINPDEFELIAGVVRDVVVVPPVASRQHDPTTSSYLDIQPSIATGRSFDVARLKIQ
jgi:hypothetical protein